MKRNIITLFFIGILSLTSSQNDFVIKDVRLFDGEKAHDKISVLIKDGNVAQVATNIKGDYEIIDGMGKTLVPAFTNAHVHAWTPASLKEAAKAGVLNLLDMHGVEQVLPFMKAYKDSTNFADYYAAGSAATAPGGHGTQYGFPAPTLSTPKEAKDFVANRIKNGADYIKIIKEPWKALLDQPTVTEVIKEAHHNDKLAVVHVSRMHHGAEVIRSGADGLVHIWRNKTMPEVTLDSLLKAHNFFVIPTALIRKMRSEYHKENNTNAEYITVEELYQQLLMLYEKKVPLIAGTDPPNLQLNYGTDLYKELEVYAEAGIPLIEVLKTATSNPAIHFKLENKGFIKEGYRADLILINGNPLENIKDINKIEAVFKAGKKVKR